VSAASPISPIDDGLRQENARLRAELAGTRAELAGTRAELAIAREHLAELVARADLADRQRAEAAAKAEELVTEVTRLAGLVAQGNERITELFAIAQRKKQGGPKAPDAPPQAPPNLPEDVRLAFEQRPTPPELPPKEKAKGRRRPTGRKHVPDHLHAEEHTVAPEACDRCGATDLEVVGQVIETKLHVVAEHQRRRVVTRKTARCKCCGTRTTARSLPAPFPRSKATCEWLAWLVHTKFAMLAPLDRIRRDLKARGIDVSMSYLVTQIERAADLLGPIDGVHWKDLLGGAWMATDATGLKVLIPGLPGTHSGHLEVYRRDDVVVFQYEAHKGSEVLANKLRPFSGVLVADAEHRHNLVFADGSVVEAGCNAHGRRKLRNAEATQPVLAKEGGAFISAIYAAEEEAKKLGLHGDALKAWRQAKVPPLQAELMAWMDAVEPTLLPDDALAKVIRYYRRHWEALFRFVDHPELPPDNSASEREYQNVAKLRLNSLFAGSTEGAHRMATLLGLVATCRSIGVDSQAYLGWALTRLGTHKDTFGMAASDLTPAAFKRSGVDPPT
jgi:transposase